jgi:RimJ/RimL family protein N-acetyltransferase
MHSPPDSPRLKFRLSNAGDEPLFLMTSTSASVMRYITGKPRTIEEARAEMIVLLKLDDGEHGHFVAEEKETGDFVGFFIVRRFEAPEETETGYRLREKYWGKGYATEGTRAVLHYIFEKLNRPFAVAVVEAGNVASRRVLEKNGFLHEKTGQFYDAELMYFKITREQFFNKLNNRA